MKLNMPPPFSILIVLVSLLFLNGCQSSKTPAKKYGPIEAEQNEKAKRETQDLKQCQQNLSALGALKADNYSDKKRIFDTLMSAASQYASVRAQVNERTQGTVDALYHYQVSYQCAEINQALLEELSKRGGAIK